MVVVVADVVAIVTGVFTCVCVCVCVCVLVSKSVLFSGLDVKAILVLQK